MKIKTFVILLSVSVLLHAESPNPLKNWKWALGVNVWSNMYYDDPDTRKATHPLEIDVMYKIKERNHLRLSVPLFYGKRGRLKERLQQGQNIRYFEEYTESILFDKIQGRTYTFLGDDNTSLYGLAIGYDRDFPFLKRFSATVGCCLAYYYHYENDFLITTQYIPVDKENFLLYENDPYYQSVARNLYAIQPSLGIQHRLDDKFLLTADIRYAMTFYKIEEITKKQHTQYTHKSPFGTQWVYSFRLYYLF